MPDRDRRRCLILGFGSFAFAWLLVLVHIALGLIFNPTRWFFGTHYAVRMDYEGLVIWKDFTLWTTIRTEGYVFLAFAISGVLCLAIGISELAREAAAKRIRSAQRAANCGHVRRPRRQASRSGFHGSLYR